MIRLSENEFQKELEAAIHANRRRLSAFAKQVERYASASYDSQYSGARDAVENHYFNIIALMAPRMVRNRPRVRTRSLLGGEHVEVARAAQFAIHAWIARERFVQTLRQAFVDDKFAFGALRVRQTNRGERTFGDTTVDIALPEVDRVSPSHVVIDPLASHVDKAAWMGYLRIVRKDQLLKEVRKDEEQFEDPGWLTSVIEDLSEDTAAVDDARDATPRSRMAAARLDDRIDLKRGEVAIYEIWHRDWEPEEGEEPDHPYHGGTAAYAILGGGENDDVTLRMIREPSPYFGPPTGPLIIGGEYVVPDNLYPLSALTASEPHIQEVRRLEEATNSGARSYKQFAVFDGEVVPEEEVLNAEHQEFVNIPGFRRDTLAQIEVGGISAQQVAMVNQARERLDRVSGIDDAIRGNVTGEGTATENEIAASNSRARTGYMEELWRSFVGKALSAVLWFLQMDDRSVLPLGEDAQAEFGQDQVFFFGGVLDEYLPEDIELEIEAGSMSGASDALQQRRAVQLADVIERVSNLYLQLRGAVDGRGLARFIGSRLDVPELDDFIDFDRLDALLQAQAQAAQQQASGNAGEGGGREPANDSAEANANRDRQRERNAARAG